MKILFLDIDGVLNSTDYMNSLYMLARIKYNSKINNSEVFQACRDKYGHLFDPRCVNFLKVIVKSTDCKIVISSTWRKSSLEVMKNLWIDRNLSGKIIGITPKFNESMCRGKEIDSWLSAYSIDLNVETYCIVDDDTIDMLPHQQKHVVKTSNRFGLDMQSTEKILKILNNENK